MMPFDVKTPELLSDPLRGYAMLHAELREVLDWQSGYSRAVGLARPMATCFGRTKEDQEEIYVPLYLEEYGDPVLAHERARARFSWHCITAEPMPSVRAYDLRSSIYSAPERAQLIIETKAKFPRVEALDHQVPGGARHLHFQISDPAGKPANWR